MKGKHRLHTKECLSLYCFIKNLKRQFHTTCILWTVPYHTRSWQLNSTAIDYALMDFSFGIEAVNFGRSIVYIYGSQVKISK